MLSKIHSSYQSAFLSTLLNEADQLCQQGMKNLTDYTNVGGEGKKEKRLRSTIVEIFLNERQNPFQEPVVLGCMYIHSQKQRKDIHIPVYMVLACK